jgi:hypothetical protein
MRFFITGLLTALFHIMSQSGHVVNVYHYVDFDMGDPVNGVQSCEGSDNLVCEWHSARDMNVLHTFLQNDNEKFLRPNQPNDSLPLTATNHNNLLTVFVANIHQWLGDGHIHQWLGDGHTMPNPCKFPVNLTLAETLGE